MPNDLFPSFIIANVICSGAVQHLTLNLAVPLFCINHKANRGKTALQLGNVVHATPLEIETGRKDLTLPRRTTLDLQTAKHQSQFENQR